MAMIAGTNPVRQLRPAPLGGRLAPGFFADLDREINPLLRAFEDPDGDDEILVRSAPARRWPGAMFHEYYDPDRLMQIRRTVSRHVGAKIDEVRRRMRLDERRHVLAVRAELRQMQESLDAVAFRHGVESAVTRTFGRQFFRAGRSVQPAGSAWTPTGVIRGLRSKLGV